MRINYKVIDKNQHHSVEKRKAQQIKKSSWWKNQLAQSKCYYCKERIIPAKLTMDHKISLARGGKSTKKNLVTSCQNCNRKKNIYCQVSCYLLN